MTYILYTEQCYEVITIMMPILHKGSRGTRKFRGLGEVVQLLSRNAGTETPA